jgi:P4 family phage/plasmid primase-like protien
MMYADEDEAAFAHEFPRAHAALGYAERGWLVLPVHWVNEHGRCTCLHGGAAPCVSAGKHPSQNNWPDQATSDTDQIIRIWGEHPLANVGIATGAVSGIFVIDVDEGIRTNGDYKQGVESKMNLEEEYGQFTPTFTVQTGGGGSQYYYRQPDGYRVKSGTKIFGDHYPDIDMRGDGGMVVAPPSISGRGPYMIENDVKAVDPPGWMIDLMLQLGIMEPLEGPHDPDPAPATVITPSPAPNWVARSVSDKIQSVVDAPDGQGNQRINDNAYMIGQYIPHGWVDRADVEQRLLSAVASWDHPHPQASYTIRRALDDGTADPYRVVDPGPTGSPASFFGVGGLLAQDLAEDVLREYPAALTPEERVALYSEGVYRRNSLALSAAVADRLGNRFREAHVSTVEEFMKARLFRENRYLPDRTTEPILNLRNGMLDLRTGELFDHDPGFMSSQQLPVDWDPNAKAPQYEHWLASVCPSQIDDLEESVSMMLDPSRSPLKHLFLFGPPSSGKSTFIRIAEKIAGAPENTSAVTLTQIIGNRFMTANIYGKILNAAADISSSHLEDIALFKQLTGDDSFTADRKHGKTFNFHSRALFMFSANELPSVGENSEAYVKRIKPFAFSLSFKDRERPEIEEQIIRDELPGILVRWVKAWQRHTERGSYVTTAPEVQQEFEIRSDRVRQWLGETMIVLGCSGGQILPVPCPVENCPHGTARTILYALFLSWAKEAGGAKLGRNKFYDRLTSVNGVLEVRVGESRTRGYNIIGQSEGDG